MEISIYSTIDFSKARNLLTERQKNIKSFNPIVPEGGCISLLELNPLQYSAINWTLINEKTGKITATTAESSDSVHYVAIPEGLRFGTYTLKIVTHRTEGEELIVETTISNPFEYIEASEDVITIVSRNLENDLVGNIPPNATITQPIYVNPGGAIYRTITISVADWDSGTEVTKTVANVTADSFLSFGWSTDAIRDLLIEFEVRPTAQGVNSITFTADSTPDAEIVLIVKIEEV